MENIFEGAKFGDKFLTRDDRIALYIFEKDKLHLLVPENYNSFNAYHANGREIEDEEHDIDIISRYQEPIDEYKLDELASRSSDNNIDFIINDCINKIDAYECGFRDGYYKAMEE